MAITAAGKSEIVGFSNNNRGLIVVVDEEFDIVVVAGDNTNAFEVEKKSHK